MDTQQHDGAQWMLESVRASLREFPFGGGDVEVMREVTRLIVQEYNQLYGWIKDGTGYNRDDAPDEICRAIHNRVKAINNKAKELGV